jgi:hypothetical protein
MPAMDRLVERLCAASREGFANPYSLEWPDRLPEDAWHFTPELISIFGTPAYEALDERARQKLSFYEAVNFFSLNVHGERSLIEGLARRLYRGEHEPSTAYLHHFLDEENKHMVYFGTFCARYAGRIYPEKKMAFPREYAPGEEDLLFFAKVLVFEEIVDVYNKRMARDERLHPLSRAINRMHHEDESRHLAFGRRRVKELAERHAPGWPPEVRAGVREYVAGYLSATWREYYNPDVYRDAGLPEPYALQRTALEATRERRLAVTRPCLAVLQRVGLLTDVPTL